MNRSSHSMLDENSNMWKREQESDNENMLQMPMRQDHLDMCLKTKVFRLVIISELPSSIVQRKHIWLESSCLKHQRSF